MDFAILVLSFLSTVSLVNGLTGGAPCKPWLVPVETDPPNHQYKPYFVALYRCNGECAQATPHRCSCVAAKTKDVTFTLFDALGTRSKVFQNHTECKNACLPTFKQRCNDGNHNWNENRCTCNCQQPPHGKTCGINEVWDTNECQCVCKNPSKKCNNRKMKWNEDSCSCECNLIAFNKCSSIKKPTNLMTCECESPPPVVSHVTSKESKTSETKLITALVVVALLLGTLFIIDLVLMCSKKGFIYSIISKCHQSPDEKPFHNTSADMDREETGSLTMENDHYHNHVPNGEPYVRA